jgi:hypothetical protein
MTMAPVGTFRTRWVVPSNVCCWGKSRHQNFDFTVQRITSSIERCPEFIFTPDMNVTGTSCRNHVAWSHCNTLVRAVFRLCKPSFSLVFNVSSGNWMQSATDKEETLETVFVFKRYLVAGARNHICRTSIVHKPLSP